MADVLARIATEEHARLSWDGTSALVVKPGPFLIAGIEIQVSQCVNLATKTYFTDIT
jgi:hypothetical protein